MARVPQRTKVLNYMMKNGSITPLDAFREFNCMRLAARISDLKEKDKVEIDDVMESYKNQEGANIRYKRYFLRKDQY